VARSSASVMLGRPVLESKEGLGSTDAAASRWRPQFGGTSCGGYDRLSQGVASPCTCGFTDDPWGTMRTWPFIASERMVAVDG